MTYFILVFKFFLFSFLLFNQLLTVEDSTEKLFQAYITADLNGRSKIIRDKNPETAQNRFTGDSKHVAEVPSVSLIFINLCSITQEGYSSKISSIGYILFEIF